MASTSFPFKSLLSQNQTAFRALLTFQQVRTGYSKKREVFFFFNGCVTAISMDTGKILDVLSKVIVKQSRLLKQSHCYKMSITRAIRNPLG